MSENQNCTTFETGHPTLTESGCICGPNACRHYVVDDSVRAVPGWPHELLSLLQLAGDRDPGAHAAIRMALASGMRQDELLALEWPEVDFKAKLVVVRGEEPLCGTERRCADLIELGNARSVRADGREIPLHSDTVKWLRTWRNTLGRLRRKYEPRHWTDRDGDLVLPSLGLGPEVVIGRAWGAEELESTFSALARRVGLDDLRFHDLRLIYGAALIGRGFPIRTVSHLMGSMSLEEAAAILGHVSEVDWCEPDDVFGGLWERVRARADG